MTLQRSQIGTRKEGAADAAGGRRAQLLQGLCTGEERDLDCVTREVGRHGRASSTVMTQSMLLFLSVFKGR